MAAVISSQDVEDLQEVRAVVAEASDRWPASASSSDLGRAGDEGVTAGPSSTAPPSSSIASTHAQSSTISTFEKGKAREEAPLECSIPESAEQGMRPSPATKVVRTVDDLEHKSCWICMDDDLPGTRFVHPCNCTLIAHESCLLTWIASQQQSKGERDPVLCPQCKAEFLIDENLGGVLKLLNRGDHYVAKASSLLLLSTVGSSVLSTSALLGFSSLRLFFGPDVACITLTGLAYGQTGLGAWRWWAWVGLPLVPVGLIANSLTTSFLAEARIKVLESLLLLTPFFLLPRPTLHHPSSPRGPWLFTRSVVGELWSVKFGAWPPGPGAVIVLLGVGEVAYLALKREVERFVLGSTLARRSLFSWLLPRRTIPQPVERRFLATPDANGGVRFRVFETNQPVGEQGAEVQTDDVALALAQARREGARVQVRVWEDDLEGMRRRRDVVEAPLNWDMFDATDPGPAAADTSASHQEPTNDLEGVAPSAADAARPAPSTSARSLDDSIVHVNASSDGSVIATSWPQEEDTSDDERHWEDDTENDENDEGVFNDETDAESDADTDDELAVIELAIAAGPPPENGPVRDGELPLEALFLSRLSLTRIAASALVMPALSALAGRGLLWIAQTYSPSLARFLGIGRRRTSFGVSIMGAAWWGSAGLASATAFDDLDPVWWRNAIGAAAIVIVRDSCSLLHKYLKIQSRKSRRIVERGLEGLDWQ